MNSVQVDFFYVFVWVKLIKLTQVVITPTNKIVSRVFKLGEIGNLKKKKRTQTF